MVKQAVIITRSRGVVEWLNQQGIHGRVLSSVSEDDIRGKVIIEHNRNLPKRLASLARGIVTIDMPGATDIQRSNQDITADEMSAAGAVLHFYKLTEVTAEDLWPTPGQHFAKMSIDFTQKVESEKGDLR
jgi:hypothetical protein